MNGPTATQTSAAGRRSWHDDAACCGADPDLFFPVGTAGPALEQIGRARRICQSCPVRKPCLDWALRHDIAFGIWGGTTEEDRHALTRPRRPRWHTGTGVQTS